MRAAASKYGGDPEVWGITGLLHDADYDQWPEEHPQRIVDWLREQGEEEIAYAVSFHQTEVEPAAEDADGQVPAWPAMNWPASSSPAAWCGPRASPRWNPRASRRSSRTRRLPPRWIERSSATAWNCLGVDFDEHIQFVIDALKPHAEELGIAGKG